MKRLTVRSLFDHSQERALKDTFSREGKLQSLSLRRVYWLIERSQHNLNLNQLSEKIFFDPISEEMREGMPQINPAASYVEIRFAAGVTDNVARSATEALMLFAPDFKKSWADFPVEVHSGWEIEILGDLSVDQIQKVLFQTIANPLLNKIDIVSGQELQKTKSWSQYGEFWKTPETDEKTLALFPLDPEFLEKINQERGLALSAEEIQTIILHFGSVEVMEQRKPLGWAGKITEVELECLAQTWSEHCKHKIFAAEIDYQEATGAFPEIPAQKITSLYKSYIQKATKDLDDCGYLVSVFKDNGGIVDFDKNLNVCVKVETHNSPSALDPFGGAITGILGVNRDILGCGLGAKPIANTDVFCLSTADLFPEANSPKRPELLKDPGVIFRGVHAGVEEGGNQSGIPTVNGAFHFASEFAAKPLIFVGSLGVMPKKVQDRDSHEKRIAAGDIIVVAGGRLGKDGVHGATFSSLALHDQVSPNVVQIGDSITQKRLLDFTLIARDRGLIQAITDNGAGGVSSSIGEMAQFSGGARMDLGKHPVKYKGLEFWEMLISESQERISYAVKPADLSEFLTLAQSLGVEASALGEFNNSGRFDVVYGNQSLASLDLHFLHEGLSRLKLKANFAGPQEVTTYHRNSSKVLSPAQNASGIIAGLKNVMAAPNVASKEDLVRYYDHEVQGATRVKPYAGKTLHGANDAGVIDLGVHGGEENNAVAVSCGLCPQYSAYDTYLMAQKAVDESFRNLVATGADPDQVALVDNFCWPDPLPKKSNPDAEHKLAQLVRACAGLYDAAVAFRAPFVSGKDSMKNDFIGKVKSGDTVKISVPPTVLVTAIARMPKAEKGAPGYYLKAHDAVYVLGTLTESLYGSAFSERFECDSAKPEYPNLKKNKDLYRKIYRAHQESLLRSCHDVSDGGLMSALVEGCFGEKLGLELNLENISWNQLWSETGSQFVVSVPQEKILEFEKHFAGSFRKLGQTSPDYSLNILWQGSSEKVNLKDLQTLWLEGVNNVYNA